MRPILILVSVLLFGAAWTNAHAQGGEKSSPKLMGSNSEGFRFVIGFMQNEVDQDLCYYGPAQLLISIASRFDANVRVTFQQGPPLDTVVKAFTVVQVGVPWGYEMIGEGVFRYGIEVTSNRPVSVTAYNSKDMTSDGYLALPVSSWGTQYISACYYVDQYDYDSTDWLGCFAVPRRGEFAVIASEDNTMVNVVPSTKTVGNINNPAGIARGQVARVLLNRGDILQIQDGGENRRLGGDPGTDLTGSVITSDKPVGLISGHVRSGVTNAFNSKDHLVEMLPPRNALGKRYMIVPFGGRTGGDVVRVTSSSSSMTNITVTSGAAAPRTTRLIQTGDFIDIDVMAPTLIVADQPVLVTQYSRSQGAGTGTMFDPDMVVVTPEEQFVNGAVFQTLENTPAFCNRVPTTKFLHHYVSLVGQSATFDATLLNGQPIGSHVIVARGTMLNTPYSWAIIEVPDNRTHVIESVGLFGGYVYGVGCVDSYAWPIGSGLRQFDRVDSDPPVVLSRLTCGAAEILALDSGRTQLGLANVWLDTVFSTNAVFEKTMVVVGDELSLGYVRQRDARIDAVARVWAEDLAGQKTSIDVLVSASAFRFSHDSISFGNMSIGQTGTRTFTITNNGTSPVTLDSVILLRGREFVLDRVPRGIALNSEGGSVTITVRYLTTVQRTNYDTLVVVADCREFRFPLVAYGITPKIATHGLDFGRVRVGNSKVMPIVVSNPGDGPLRVDSTSFNGPTFTTSSELKWPVWIAAGDDTTAIDVTFRPTATRDFTGLGSFFSNADSVALSPLTGTGIYPALAIVGFDFGRIQLGDTLCTTIPVINIGSDTAFLRGLDLPNPDAFLPDAGVFVDPASPGKAYPLAPGDTLWVPVCFAPTKEKDYLTDVSPRNDDDLTASHTLRGSGYILRATLGGADLGRHWIGTFKDSTVYISNVGTDPITVDSIWLGSGDIGDFMIDPLQQEITLAPGARYPIAVRFSPIVPGDRVASIHAHTLSRNQPQLDSVLIGFGLFAMSSDTLMFDDDLAYACSDRGGRVEITNIGNTPLTIASIVYESTPQSMVVNAPAPGYTIAIGEALDLDFTLTFSGYTGVTRGSISWTFEEPPNAQTPRTFTREFSISSTPQAYFASAIAPPKVIPGQTFELAVRIDSAQWAMVTERDLELTVTYDPAMTRFDSENWSAPETNSSDWVGGQAKEVVPGTLTVHYTTSNGSPLPIAGVTLPPIPFQAFISDHEVDTLLVALSAIGNQCASPALTGARIALDSICGLSMRLFEFTGSPFVLRQNRPNPVREKTEIFFTLGMESDTRLELFGADGRLVRLLVDGVLKGGEYSIPLDVHEMPSGLYYYRLTSGTFTASRQMQIAK